MQYRRSYGTRRAPPRPFRLGGVAKLEEVEKMVGEQQMDEVSSSTSAVKRVKKEIGDYFIFLLKK
jgi:hypothetical protein